jgi:hypothetical protein
VALRDIKEGEEVFMDYGEEWEAAWDAHVAEWYPPAEALAYVHRSDWPEDHVRTVDEGPYPENLVTVCVESYTSAADPDDDDGALVHSWAQPMSETPHRVYCRALERTSKAKDEEEDDEDEETEAYVYKVELDVEVDGEPPKKVVVDGVPSTGIFLVDRAYSQDWHLPRAFRHEIMIPDDLLPDAWRNGPPPHPSGDRDSDPQFGSGGGSDGDSSEDDDSDDDDDEYE